MANAHKIAGVVLAGGKSSRMGRDKAMLPFQGGVLLDHMMELLRLAGCDDVYVSGQYEGRACIPDAVPHLGPAVAMRNIMMNVLPGENLLFVPVDMPFLTVDVLRMLLLHRGGGFFAGHPLPVFVPALRNVAEAQSVRDLVSGMGIDPLASPQGFEKFFLNLNTPQEWMNEVKECISV